MEKQDWGFHLPMSRGRIKFMEQGFCCLHIPGHFSSSSMKEKEWFGHVLAVGSAALSQALCHWGVLSDNRQGTDVLDVLFPASQPCMDGSKPQLHRTRYLYQTKSKTADVAPASKTKSALKCLFVPLFFRPADKNQGRCPKTLQAPNPWIFLSLAGWDL